MLLTDSLKINNKYPLVGRKKTAQIPVHYL